MRLCEWPECGRPFSALGLCRIHYRRQREKADMDAPITVPALVCIWPKCRRQRTVNGLCQLHDIRKKLGTDMDAAVPGSVLSCKWPKCERAHQAKGFCALHYSRQSRGLKMDAPIKEKKQTVWTINRNGYLQGTINGKTALQHRYVWEIYHDIKLRPFENVHHKNGIRNDNRIENLELWTKPQPCGQRPEDLVAWTVAHYPELVKAYLALFSTS